MQEKLENPFCPSQKCIEKYLEILNNAAGSEPGWSETEIFLVSNL